MIRMVQSTSAAHAKDYFTDALLKSDYYLDDQELQGRLMGRLGDRLGINGVATKDNFFALCENRNPKTDKQLTPRTNEERTTGYDINFHVPKSVSIVHALSKDDHILKAFQSSIRETMADIEADSKTRVRKDGTPRDRETGELVWAEFVHQTARPVDGSAPDPHLHAHCFVFNATYDEKEKKIKAGQFRDIKRDMPYYQSRFHKKLSDKLIGLGYQVKRTDKSFELEGVPKSVIDLFSKRTNEIGEFAKEKGITDAKELDKLGALTRSNKQKGMGMAELKKEWRRQISENTVQKEDEQETVIRHAPKKQKPKIMANDCIDFALDHSFERASVIQERRLLEVAYKHAIGDNSLATDDITASYKNDKRIIQVKERYQIYCTTKQVLAEEKQMVELARKGVGRFQPLYKDAPNINLDGQQLEAANHVLTTKDQVSIIRGAAGAGKTKMMQQVVPLMEKRGKMVTVLAPSADASRGVLASEGFKDATTVARFLLDKKMQEELQGQILWVDEAGLLGTKDMSALLSIADKRGARVVLGGDTRQHASVIRGDALRILNTIGGIRTAEVTKIYRQKDVEYRKAVEELSKGNIRQAFDKLDGIGSIKTVDRMRPNDALVDDYIKATKKGKTALIVSPTHKQGEAVTIELREKLKSARKLGKKEIIVPKLDNLNLTEAQKSDWRNFKNGQVVRFNQNVPKIKRGSIWTVDGVSEKAVEIKNETGEKLILPQEKAAAFSVYNKSEIGLSKGDKIKITHGIFDVNEKRLDNGAALEVVNIRKRGKIVLMNTVSKTSYELDADVGHITHAYCSTSHSAQGKTVDRVFISQPSSTFTATDAKQFYVSVSRGRDAATIYTDDKDALLEYASEIGDRQSAIELVNRKSHIDHVLQRERNDYQKEKQPSVEKNIINKQQKEWNHEPRI